MPIKPLKVTSAIPLGKDQFLEETIAGLKSLLGPFTKDAQIHNGTKYGASVVGCKPQKAKALIKLLESLDFTTVDRPIAFIAGGMRLEDTGEKTFVNYNSMLGVLIVGTTIQKNALL